MDDTLLDQLKAYKNFQSSKYIPVRGDEIKSRVFEFDKTGIDQNRRSFVFYSKKK